MHEGQRTTVILAGAVERTPRRTRGVIILAFEVEHDERQLQLSLEDDSQAPARSVAA